MIGQRFEDMQPDKGQEQSQEPSDASEDRARDTRVRQRTLSREEWRNLGKHDPASPDAEYLEIGWKKTAREDLRRIHDAIDELRDGPVKTKRPSKHPGRVPKTTRRIPTGLRSRVSDALGSIAYVQLVYTTREHHVCRVGVRDGARIEDQVVLVGPETVRLADDLEATIDDLIDRAIAQADERASSTPEPEAEGPFGRVYEVEEVEGIGDTYTDDLAELGIADTRTLWHADPDTIADRLDVSPKVVQRWRTMAELMAINGIGPQYAELLARSGVGSISALADAEASELLEAIEAKQEELEVRIQGNVIKEKTVQNWIDLARNHDA